jgi:hypothetical protein
LAAALGSSFGVREASVATPFSGRWFGIAVEAAEKAFRDTGVRRIGSLFCARLGTRKSSTGGRYATSRLEASEAATIDIVTSEKLLVCNKKNKPVC